MTRYFFDVSTQYGIGPRPQQNVCGIGDFRAVALVVGMQSAVENEGLGDESINRRRHDDHSRLPPSAQALLTLGGAFAALAKGGAVHLTR